MKQIALAIVFCLCCCFANSQSIGIGTTSPDNSAALEIQSTSKGLLIPRMTMTQRNTIVSPAMGLLIYQLDNSEGFYYNAGTPVSPSWKMLGRRRDTIAVSKHQFKPNSNNIGYEVSVLAGVSISLMSSGNDLFAPVTFPPGGTIIQMIIYYRDFSSQENLQILLLKDNLITNSENGTGFSFLTSGSVSGIRTAIVNGNFVVDSSPYFVMVSGESGTWMNSGQQLSIRGIQFILLY